MDSNDSVAAYFKRNNLEIVVPELEAEVFPGGETIKVNGTVQDLHAKLLSLNPNWDKDFPDADEGKGVTPNRDHAKRSIFLYQNVWCDGPYGLAATEPLTNGISYLRKLKGQPWLDKGCARVSCSWKSAIYWCNLVRSYNFSFYAKGVLQHHLD